MRMMMTKAALPAALLAASTMIPTSAAADTASGGSIGTSGPTDYSAMIGYLSKFNSNAGTLNSATLTYGYGFNSTITVSATTDSTGFVRTKSAAQFASSDSAIAALFNQQVNTTSATIGSAALTPAAYDLLGGSSIYSVGPSIGQTSANYSSTASASRSVTITGSSLAAFIASQNSAVFDVYGKTLTGLLLSATGGNASASQQTVANSTFSVLYNYTPGAISAAVPEPSSWIMMILGFGVIGYAMRRKTVLRYV